MVAHGRVLRAPLAATLVAMALAIPAAAQTRSDKNLSRIHIDNFGQVNANYYRGAQPVLHDYADLKALGIKTVIDFTEDGDRAEPGIVKWLGMNFYRIPMDTHRLPTSDQIAQFLRIVNDPANQPVYVHCQGDRHRTGLMTAVYRMTNDAWTSEQAFAEMKHYRFGADFLHPEFKQFVYAFKPEAKGTLSTVVALTSPK